LLVTSLQNRKVVHLICCYANLLFNLLSLGIVETDKVYIFLVSQLVLLAASVLHHSLDDQALGCSVPSLAFG
jgi:hypothetical protein